MPFGRVVGHERLIKCFKCYCYIDHKNNIFSDAQLDNRRRSKKMSNWALELQQFNIERIWERRTSWRMRLAGRLGKRRPRSFFQSLTCRRET